METGRSTPVKMKYQRTKKKKLEGKIISKGEKIIQLNKKKT